jgi:hypothetical protein
MIRETLRMGAACLLAIGCTTAYAQSSEESRSADRVFQASREADFDNWVLRANRAKALTPAQQTARAVVAHIERKDCAAAIAELNKGLGTGNAEVQVFAGTLYENGVCLKQNAERAMQLYERADAAEHPGAAARMVAILASADAASDYPSAIWWAHKAKLPLAPPCQLSAAQLASDSSIVAALSVWPAAQLQSCAETAAVVASVEAELRSPEFLDAIGLLGSVQMRFQPALRNIDWQTDVRLPSRVGAAESVERESREAQTAFASFLRKTGERAIARFPTLSKADPQWRIEARYSMDANAR